MKDVTQDQERVNIWCIGVVYVLYNGGELECVMSLKNKITFKF